MSHSLALLLTAYIPCLSPSSSAWQMLPAEWPPLPDFKTPVDYVQWYRDQVHVDPKDDGRAMYDQLFPDDESEQGKRADAWLWGKDARGGIPGLFTGIENLPEQWAWNPADHPEWERAYQAQVRSGVLDNLRYYSRFQGLSRKIWWEDPASWWDNPDHRGKLTTKPVDFGFVADDHLLILARSNSRLGIWQIVKVLLQNSWRAYDDRVMSDQMAASFAETLRILNQIGGNNFMDHYTDIGCRKLLYRNAVKALSEQALDEYDIQKVLISLKKLDGHDLSWPPPDAEMLADGFDLLQFIYPPTPSGAPRADLARLGRLYRYLRTEHERFPKFDEAPLDLPGLIDTCSPQQAVQQIAGLYLDTRRIQVKYLPTEAESKAEECYRQFRDDAENHVLVRQLVYPSFSVVIRIGAESEAWRRATQLIYGLHVERNRTGEWPNTLNDLRNVPPACLFDPFSRKKFCYRVEGDAMTLYSVAANGQDDDGKHDSRWGVTYKDRKQTIADTDYVFWPVPDKEW